MKNITIKAKELAKKIKKAAITESKIALKKQTTAVKGTAQMIKKFGLFSGRTEAKEKFARRTEHQKKFRDRTRDKGELAIKMVTLMKQRKRELSSLLKDKTRRKRVYTKKGIDMSKDSLIDPKIEKKKKQIERLIKVSKSFLSK